MSHYGCVECEVQIIEREYNYSISNFGHPLCRYCQNWLKDIMTYSTATDYSIELYFALRRRGVGAELEKCDGYKTIDIAIPDSKVNVEVDGGHHNFNHRQALSDLQRTYTSFKKGYLTLRIPNSLVRYHLDEAADMVASFVTINKNRIKKSRR